MPENIIYTNRFTISVNDNDVHVFFQTESPTLDKDGKSVGQEFSERTHFVMTRKSFDVFLALGQKVVKDQNEKAKK